MKAERNGSIELLRIIAMASVIGHHFLKWGGYWMLVDLAPLSTLSTG